VSKYVLQAIGKLVGVDVAEAVLHMGVHDKFGKPQYFAA